jgi:cell division septum initiation protein DivIVA
MCFASSGGIRSKFRPTDGSPSSEQRMESARRRPRAPATTDEVSPSSEQSLDSAKAPVVDLAGFARCGSWDETKLVVTFAGLRTGDGEPRRNGSDETKLVVTFAGLRTGDGDPLRNGSDETKPVVTSYDDVRRARGPDSGRKARVAMARESDNYDVHTTVAVDRPEGSRHRARSGREPALHGDTYVDADAIAAREFKPSPNGYEPNEVRAYLVAVAEAVKSLSADRDRLVARVEELEARVSSRDVAIDSVVETITAEVASVVTAAKEASQRIIDKARAQAAEIVAEAENRAEQITASAKRRLEESQAEIEKVAETRISEAQKKADELVGEARQLRREILADLAERYRSGRQSLEIVKAAHSEIHSALTALRDRANELLANAGEAMERAKEAADSSHSTGGPTVEQIEAALELLSKEATRSDEQNKPSSDDEDDRAIIAALFARIRADTESLQPTTSKFGETRERGDDSANAKHRGR